ncbi:MAG: A24 family peptidase [Cetobacterium sp.]
MYIGIVILVAIIDMNKKIIPNIFTLSLILLGIIYNYIYFGSIERSIIGGGVFASPFLLIYGYGYDFFKKECLGFGDVKFIFAIGCFLGYTDLYSFLIFINGIFTIALIVVLLFFKKIKKNQEIPFAPFISFMAIIYPILEGFI